MSEDRELQGKVGQAIGRIIAETENLPHRERQAEIENRVRTYLAER
jgi:hypothetical protein